MDFGKQTPRRDLIDVAMGKESADYVIRGAKLVNVHTVEIYPADVAVKGTRIAYVGDVSHTVGDKTKIIDASGKYLVPGCIETHQHVGGSQLTMTEFAKAVIPHGTTGIITDFYEIGIVRGKKAIRFCLDEMKKTPLKCLYQVASQIYVQNGPFGNTGQVTAGDLYELLAYPECIGVSEWPAELIVNKDPVVLGLIEETLRQGKLNLGHDSETPEHVEQAYVCMGHSSTHECVEVQEVVDRARLGQVIMTRQGTAARDIEKMSRAIVETGLDTRGFTMCTDEEEVAELYSYGHTDAKIRGMVERGVSPMTAIQMATINAAEYAGVASDMGSIVPGKIADIVILKDLPHYDIDLVMANGEIVAKDYRYTGQLTPVRYPDFAYNTVILPKERMCAEDFRIPSPRDGTVKCHVIGQRNGLLVTQHRQAEMTASGGFVEADVSRDILKFARIDRYGTSKKWSTALVQGFGLKKGAIGNTWNGQKEDIFLVGTNGEDMAAVANRLAENGGGFAAAVDGKIVAEVPMPLFGLLSEKPFLEVVKDFLAFNEVVKKEMGCVFDGPMTQLALMGVPVEIGELKLSEFGLVEVWKGKRIPVVMEGE